MNQEFKNLVFEHVGAEVKACPGFLGYLHRSPENFRIHFVKPCIQGWSGYAVYNKKIEGFEGIPESEDDAVSKELLVAIQEHFKQELKMLKMLETYPEKEPDINEGDKRWLVAQFDELYSNDHNFLRALKSNPEKIRLIVQENILVWVVFSPVGDDIAGLYINSPERASWEVLKALLEHFAEKLEAIS